MKPEVVRSLVAQGVIGLAVCIGGYAAVVMPLREKAAKARAELAEAQALAGEATALEGSMEVVMRRLADAQAHAEAIRAGGGMARSQEALYAAVNASAAALGLRIDEFSPVDSGAGLKGMGPAAPGDVILRCRFAVTGSFSQVAGLLRLLVEEGGFATVRSVRLEPASGVGEQTVHADVETEHYAVDPTPRTATVGEGQR